MIERSAYTWVPAKFRLYRCQRRGGKTADSVRAVELIADVIGRFRLFRLRAQSVPDPSDRELANLLPVRLGRCQAHSLSVYHDPQA